MSMHAYAGDDTPKPPLVYAWIGAQLQADAAKYDWLLAWVQSVEHAMGPAAAKDQTGICKTKCQTAVLWEGWSWHMAVLILLTP